MKERTTLEERMRITSLVKEKLNASSARLLNLVLSGSDLYGFSSEDSDFDYRGIYVTETSRILGLGTPRDVVEIKEGENDIVLFEVKKAIGLTLSSNCNALEHLVAPQVYAAPEFLPLQEQLLVSYGKKGLYNSYKGLATFNYRKYIASGRKNSVKKYLYVFRGLMAGIYALEVLSIEPNIEALNTYFKIKEVKDLIKLKRAGKENGPLPAKLDKGQIEAVLLGLFEKIDKVYKRSTLPETPRKEDVEWVEKWLLQIRKDRFQ